MIDDGLLSTAHFSALLRIFRATQNDAKEIPEALQESPIFEQFEAANASIVWAEFYELPFTAHLLVAMELFGLASLTRPGISPSEQIELLLSVEKLPDDSGIYEKLDTMSMVEKAAVMACAHSMFLTLKCLVTYSAPINTLVERVRAGSDDAFHNIITVDPAAVLAPTMAKRLSNAAIANDRPFLRRYRKALGGPHKGREPYSQLRLVEAVLADTEAFQKMSREDIHTLVVHDLKLYGSKHGDTLKGLFSRFSDWRREATS
jgi:hypothetical protein